MKTYQWREKILQVCPQRVAAIFQKELMYIIAIQKQELHPIDDVDFDDLEKLLKI